MPDSSKVTSLACNKTGFPQLMMRNLVSLETLIVRLLPAPLVATLLFWQEEITGNDLYYHFQIAREIAPDNLMSDINSLPLTILGRL